MASAMAGFTDVSWINRTVPKDHLLTGEDDNHSMVPIVDSILRCGQSFDKSSKSINYKKLRVYIRQGLSPVLRPNTWKTLSGSRKVSETTPSLFKDIQDDLEYALFTGTDHFFNASFIEKHYLTDEGWKKCGDVLAVLSQLHCDVTFCPILQQLVCIFMHFMDKEDCFACIDSLLGSRKYSLDKSATDYCITAKTFQDALKKWKKPVYTWLKSLFKKGENVNWKNRIYCVDWLQWIFKYLDFWTLVHLIDNFLLEGNKVFYRVGLVLFEQVYNVHKNEENANIDELEKIFGELTSKSSTQSSQLISKSLKIPGVSRQIILQLRQRNISLEQSGALTLPNIEHETVFHGVVEGSDLLSQSQVQELFAALPRRLRQLCKLTCIFSTEVHGTSLTSFYQKCQEKRYTVLIVKTTNQEIIGAFLSAPWNERFVHQNRFFGNGETFLFHFLPEFKRYTWRALTTKDNNTPAFFMLADSERIVVGGGSGWGLSIEEDLTHGRSEKCGTFENEPLSCGNTGEFECVRIEVWGLEEMGHLATSMEMTDEHDEHKISFFSDNG